MLIFSRPRTINLVDTKRRPSLYFYHIPKTGGMSIRSFLADQYYDQERCPAATWNDLARLSREELAQFRLFMGHFSANCKMYLPNVTHSMMLIRDPVRRTISNIKHTIRDPRFQGHERLKNMTIRQVIDDDELLNSYANLQTKLICFDIPTGELVSYSRLQNKANREFTFDDFQWDSSYEKALRVVDSFDLVATTDDFELSILNACRAFRLTPPRIMPRLNHTVDRDDLDEEGIERIRRFQADDLRLFEMVRGRLSAAPDTQSIFAELLRAGVIREIREPFKLDLGRPFLGCGWYEPELHAGRPARWSGPETKAILYLPISRRRRRVVEIKVLKPDALPDIELRDGETRLDVRTVQEGGVLAIKVELPRLPDRGPWVTLLTIDYGRTIGPEERGGADPRPLGLVLLEAVVR